MANSLAVDEDFGARLSRLNLPPKPLVMDKFPHRPCPHHREKGDTCFCFEYTTLLDRPEYTGKWRQDSPEPEIKAPKPVNGKAATKKFSLGQYMGKTKGTSSSSSPSMPNGTKIENRSNSRPPTSVANTPAKPTPPSKASTATQAKTSTPPVPRRHPLPPPPPPPPSSTASAAAKPVPNPRQLAGEKRPPEAMSRSPSTTKNSRPVGKSSQSSETLRPVKRRRTPSPPPPPPRPQVRASMTPVLPPMLSPTLPPAVEEALALDNKLRSSGKQEPLERLTAKPMRSRAVSNPMDRPSLKAGAAGKKLPASSANTPSGRSPRPPPAASPAKPLKKTGLGGVASKTAARSPNPVSGKTTSSKHLPAPRSSRIVILKFSKRKFKDVQTLMKLPSKRQRPDDDPAPSGPVKRQKLPGAAKASAVRSPAFKSPAPKQQSRDKEAVTPPKRTVNGPPGLRRSESSGPATTPSTREEKNGVIRELSESGKKPIDGATSLLCKQYSDEYQKYSDIGRQAKHEADRIFRSQPPADEPELRYALVVAVDSTLCFVLAFILCAYQRQLEQRAPPLDVWRTAIPLSMFVSDKAKALNYPAMHGFCKQLEATIRQCVLDLDMNVFGKTPLPDTTSKAPTPDSSNARTNDRTKFERTKSSLVQDYHALSNCWNDGMKHLTYDEIQRDFPFAFAGRSKQHIDPTSVAPKGIERYGHEYVLPLHRNTTPLEAVNFGRRFVEEWAAAKQITQANGNRYQSRLAPCLL